MDRSIVCAQSSVVAENQQDEETDWYQNNIEHDVQEQAVLRDQHPDEKIEREKQGSD